MSQPLDRALLELHAELAILVEMTRRHLPDCSEPNDALCPGPEVFTSLLAGQPARMVPLLCAALVELAKDER